MQQAMLLESHAARANGVCNNTTANRHKSAVSFRERTEVRCVTLTGDFILPIRIRQQAVAAKRFSERGSERTR